MARGRSGAGKGLGGLRTSGGEAVQLVVDYVKQETLTPLKGLGRFIVFGVVGSVALAIGLVILSIAFLRVLQGETGTTFTGKKSVTIDLKAGQWFYYGTFVGKKTYFIVVT